jgi:hypothetical protein
MTKTHRLRRASDHGAIALRFAFAGVVLLFAFTAIFVRAFNDPLPHDVKIAVVGPPAALAQVRSGLNPEQYYAVSYGSATAARTALAQDQVRGIVVSEPQRTQVVIASAYGFMPGQIVKGALAAVAAQAGKPVQFSDLRPLPSGDARGLASFFTVLGTTIASLVFAVLLTFIGGRHAVRARVLACAFVAVLGGIAVALSVDSTVGALTGSFWGVAAIAALLIAAIVTVTHGMGRLFGPVGIAVSAVSFILLGISSSGGGVGYQMEPGFYRAVSQILPSGSALTAVRNEVYFSGAHTLGALLVLGAWIVFGALALTLGHRRGPLVLTSRTAVAAA